MRQLLITLVVVVLFAVVLLIAMAGHPAPPGATGAPALIIH